MTCSDGTEQNLGVVVGKDGADGVNGADGKDGVDGKDGATGQDVRTEPAAHLTSPKTVALSLPQVQKGSEARSALFVISKQPFRLADGIRDQVALPQRITPRRARA